MPMSITKVIKKDVNFVEKGIISDIQILKIKNIFAYNFTFPIVVLRSPIVLYQLISSL